MSVPSRKGLAPFLIGVALVAALLAYGGVKTLVTGEAVFRPKSISSSKATYGPSRTVRGAGATTSGVGLLLIAAGVVMLGALVVLHQVRGAAGGNPAKPMPVVLCLWILGAVLTFAPASCSSGRGLNHEGTKTRSTVRPAARLPRIILLQTVSRPVDVERQALLRVFAPSW